MSAVRMCDRCGSVFSELADGWQAFTATMIKKNDTGRREAISQNLDACPACALAPVDKDAPPALVNPGASTDPSFFAKAAVEKKQEALEERLAKLEAATAAEPAAPEAVQEVPVA